MFEDVARHRLAPHGGQTSQLREPEFRNIPEVGQFWIVGGDQQRVVEYIVQPEIDWLQSPISKQRLYASNPLLANVKRKEGAHPYNKRQWGCDARHRRKRQDEFSSYPKILLER